MEAGVVNVEMRADDGVHFVWPDTEFSEVIEDIFFARGGRRSVLARVGSHACVDQDVFVRGFRRGSKARPFPTCDPA